MHNKPQNRADTNNTWKGHTKSHGKKTQNRRPAKTGWGTTFEENNQKFVIHNINNDNAMIGGDAEGTSPSARS